MSYKRGSFGNTSVNRRGPTNSVQNHLMIKAVQTAFKQLNSTVTDAAERATTDTTAQFNSYKMSFDEVQVVPVVVPAAGTIQISVSTDNPVELETYVSTAAAQLQDAAVESLKNQLKEAGL